MKTTVQVEGKSVEVEIPGVISEADVAARYMPKDVFEAELARRGTSIAEKAGYINPKTLDDAGKQKLAESLGLKPAAGNDGDVGKQLERAQKEWAARELTPVVEREQAAKTEIETLRRDRLTDGLVAAAARAGVKAVLLNPPAPGAKPPIVAMLEQSFGFDEKTRNWYAKGTGEQPFLFAAQPTGAQPYKTVDEFLGDWARVPGNKEFIGITTQQGPGLQGGGSGGGAGVVISRADYKNPTKYRIAKEAAAKAGVELQVVD
jgi:hypothetical protein